MIFGSGFGFRFFLKLCRSGSDGMGVYYGFLVFIEFDSDDFVWGVFEYSLICGTS